MPLVGDNEWLQSAAGGQKTTEGAAPDFVILIALCGLNCFIVPNKQQRHTWIHGKLRSLDLLTLIPTHSDPYAPQWKTIVYFCYWPKTLKTKF